LSCPQGRFTPEGHRQARPAREPRRHRRRLSGTAATLPLLQHPLPCRLPPRRLWFRLLLPAGGGMLPGPHWSAVAQTHLQPTPCRPRTPQRPFPSPLARRKERSHQHARTGAAPMRPMRSSPRLTARRTSASSPHPTACPGARGFKVKDRLGDQSGGIEWEPIKILLQRENSPNASNSQPRIPTRVCQGSIVTAHLPTLGATPNDPKEKAKLKEQKAYQLSTGPGGLSVSTGRTIRKAWADCP
jgi:hypothetical protein